ncbi:MAG: hypothetical protein RR123_05110, partial [Clostridia bacterium]
LTLYSQIINARFSAYRNAGTILRYCCLTLYRQIGNTRFSAMPQCWYNTLGEKWKREFLTQ